ncbi:dihydrodipicolinate synthase family protein [Georgenia subflava]|uniref:Dihydrodipicolinate synthase family protein n=1 Tax=Georgenia subflava TaxID=1622177 RepID=A0A6N7EEY3_9MICO|nr:dihydrodipicolinate synthase family protein [Georgenia subflava]MPV35518.1 dihydrodipicolinate synthase family protein [Georgenia subflava]
MRHSTIRGVVPPVVTPFHPDGTVDTVSLARVVDHLADAGCDALFALGSTGEVAYLDRAQRALVVRTAVEAAAGRVPVLAGAIDMTAGRVLEQVAEAVAAGADGIVATAPIYARNDAAEIEAHFRAIGAGCPVPLFAYDIPVRVHTKLDHTMLVRLGLDGVIAGVKDSSGDDVGLRRLVAANAAAGSPLTVLTGHEVVVDAMMLLGADGVVPGLGNVDPHGYVRLLAHAQAGRWEEARAEQDRLAALFEIVFQSPGRSGDAAGVGAFKAAMHHLGLIDSATMAPPVQAPDQAAVAQIVAILDATGLRSPAAAATRPA